MCDERSICRIADEEEFSPSSDHASEENRTSPTLKICNTSSDRTSEENVSPSQKTVTSITKVKELNDESTISTASSKEITTTESCSSKEFAEIFQTAIQKRKCRETDIRMELANLSSEKQTGSEDGGEAKAETQGKVNEPEPTAGSSQANSDERVKANEPSPGLSDVPSNTSIASKITALIPRIGRRVTYNLPSEEPTDIPPNSRRGSAVENPIDSRIRDRTCVYLCAYFACLGAAIALIGLVHYTVTSYTFCVNNPKEPAEILCDKSKPPEIYEYCINHLAKPSDCTLYLIHMILYCCILLGLCIATFLCGQTARHLGSIH